MIGVADDPGHGIEPRESRDRCTDGGKIGVLILSPFTKGTTTSTVTYNHYGLLASIEDIFSLPPLGYARARGVKTFGIDVFNARS